MKYKQLCKCNKPLLAYVYKRHTTTIEELHTGGDHIARITCPACGNLCNMEIFVEHRRYGFLWLRKELIATMGSMFSMESNYTKEREAFYDNQHVLYDFRKKISCKDKVDYPTHNIALPIYSKGGIECFNN